MYSITRVFWGSTHARTLRELLQPGSSRGRRLDAFLKNPAINVHAYISNGTFGGYFATSTAPGDKTLACHHFEEIKKESVTTSVIQLMLDHTGTDNIMMFGESPEMVKQLERIKFILIEDNWHADTRPYRDLPLDKRIVDISLLPEELVTEDNLHELDVILSCALVDEGEYDPLRRNILRTILPRDILERARTGQYRTLAWIEGGVIKGMVQLEYTSWGGVSLTGMGVSRQSRKQRIGRNLVAAAMKLASSSHETITATSFAGNVEAEHLLGRILRYSKLPGTYGMNFSPDAVSWKRSSKHHKGTNEHEHGPSLVE